MAQIQSGQTYKITNVKGGTIIDLSGGDNKSSQYNLHGLQFRSTDSAPVIGYEDHNGPNQRVIVPLFIWIIAT
jgi:hypothetical protein